MESYVSVAVQVTGNNDGGHHEEHPRVYLLALSSSSRKTLRLSQASLDTTSLLVVKFLV